MRRYQKQQIEEFIRLLEEAHASIRGALRSEQRDAALALLAQCQEGAISLGNLIEGIEGEGAGTVALLEDYCERVYQCCEAVRREDPAMSGKRVYKTLSGSLGEIEGSVKRDLRTRIEAVFLPYKASMWDSLESVWRAADADPDCDAYVVPIPYYNKNPDGSLGQMCYEGGEYPSYVPVVDWRTYDLEKRRPDVAFIHNPYDDRNLVTEVHSDYFSGSLRKHTGFLCYIPYFVAARGASAHFACMPGVVNSDLTIVESERIRQEYLSVWKDLVQRGQAAPERLKSVESRILALGSPKYDAVLENQREAYELPDKWRQLLDNPDGSRKKVVFFNTSLGTMLERTVDAEGRDSGQYLRKIESVLHYFKRREDAILLWRPHPLMESSFASMRPELHGEYRRIVRDYQEACYGIYDDSADLGRAIAVSDAYYGDVSSVMYLWEKTQKPLLISNADVTSYQRRLVVTNLYFDGACLWCTSDDFNGLFQIERETLRARYVGQFPGEEKESCCLFGQCAEWGGKLYFAPWRAEHIGVYDKETGELSAVPIPVNDEERRLACKYYEAFAYDGRVYFVGSEINAILCLDTRTNTVAVLDGWRRRLEAREDDGKETFLSYACRSGSKAYIFSKYANAMLRLDLSSHSWELIPFPGRNRKYFWGLCLENAVWCCSNSEASVGFYDISTGRIVDLEVPDLFAGGFSGMWAYREYVYCFSRRHSKLLKIHTRTFQTGVYEGGIYGVRSVQDGGTVYTVSQSAGKIRRFDLETMSCQAEETLRGDMPDINSRAVLESFKKHHCFVTEDAFLNLDALVDIAGGFSPDGGAKEESCGAAIYRHVKKVIS